MRWFKQVNSSDRNYLPVPTRLEEDDGRLQLSLESEDLLLNELILSRTQQETTRRSIDRSASVRRNQTEKWPFKPATGGAINLSNRDSDDPLLQRLESENQQMNEMILRRAQSQQDSHFVSLVNDNAAQDLLESMRQHSNRLRCTRARQRPADTPSSDVQSLRDELENLRHENEIYHSLVRQTPQMPQLTDNPEAQRLRDKVVELRWENERLRTQLVASYFPPPDYAPPPYARAD